MSSSNEIKKKIVNDIKEAQDLDNSDRHLEAIKKYVSCIKSLADQLLLLFHNIAFEFNELSSRYVELSCLCCERMKLISQKFQDETLYKKCNENKCFETEMTPMEKALLLNRKLADVYRSKQASSNSSSPSTPSNRKFKVVDTQLTVTSKLSLHRKMNENLNIAKRQQEMIEKRQKDKLIKMEMNTENRFQHLETRNKNSFRKKAVYSQIMLFEEKKNELKKFREMGRDEFLHTSNFKILFEVILKSKDHPYKEYLQSLQYDLVFQIKKYIDARKEGKPKEKNMSGLLGLARSYVADCFDMFLISYNQFDKMNEEERAELNDCIKAHLDEYFYEAIWTFLRDLMKVDHLDQFNNIKEAIEYFFPSTSDAERPRYPGVEADSIDPCYFTPSCMDIKPCLRLSNSVSAYKTVVQSLKDASLSLSITSKTFQLISIMHKVCKNVKDFYLSIKQSPPEIVQPP